MTEFSPSAVKGWCDARLSENIAHDLDTGEMSPMDFYKEFAAKGWIEFADIFKNPQNLPQLMKILKITSRYSGVLCNMIAVNAVGAILLSVFGSNPQKETAQKTMRGKQLLSFSLTEPEAGSDIQNLKTTGEKINSHWVLNGEKYLATGADMADLILVVARTATEKPINKAISVFLVPRNTPGMSIAPQKKMATNGFSSCEITLSSVTLPEEAVVGAKDSGWGAIAFVGGIERLMVAATCVGLSHHILKYLYEFTQKRIIQDRPLFDIQVINHQMADLAIQIKAADLMVENAISLLLQGKTPALEICGAKVFASETQQAASMAAMKIMGGRAYLTSFPAQRWLREGLLSLYAGGTNELQKNIIVRKLPNVLVSDAI